MKRTSKYSEQWLFRKEVLNFTREKLKFFLELLSAAIEGGGMEK